MAPRRKSLAGSWRGPRAEVFTAITWQPLNRARHEAAYPDRPRFTAAELADWSRIHKRIDVEHSKSAKTGFKPCSDAQSPAPTSSFTRRSILWHTPRAMASSRSSPSASPTRASGPYSSELRQPHSGDGDDVPPTMDRDAQDALAWIESGMPDDAIGYGPDAPRLTQAQLDEFKPASYTRSAGPRRRRQTGS